MAELKWFTVKQDPNDKEGPRFLDRKILVKAKDAAAALKLAKVHYSWATFLNSTPTSAPNPGAGNYNFIFKDSAAYDLLDMKNEEEATEEFEAEDLDQLAGIVFYKHQKLSQEQKDEAREVVEKGLLETPTKKMDAMTATAMNRREAIRKLEKAGIQVKNGKIRIEDVDKVRSLLRITPVDTFRNSQLFKRMTEAETVLKQMTDQGFKMESLNVGHERMLVYFKEQELSSADREAIKKIRKEADLPTDRNHPLGLQFPALVMVWPSRKGGTRVPDAEWKNFPKLGKFKDEIKKSGW